MRQTQVFRIAGPKDWPHPLGLCVKQPASRDSRLPPLLLLHGATFSSGLFNLPSEGYSLMDALAEAGRPVYALDIRGYGRSLAGPAMEALPPQNPPFARAKDAIADVVTTADWILDHEHVAAIDIAGFSWGTIIAGAYAGTNPHKVRRLAMYAPLHAQPNPAWLQRIADPHDRTRLASKFGAYRMMSEPDIVARWDAELPGGDPACYREQHIAALLFDAIAASDPTAASRSPKAFRCPNGALADLVDVFNGKPLFDPGRLTMPVFLVRGAQDTTSTEAECRALLAALGTGFRDYLTISPGSHFLCIEKNRAKLHNALNVFLNVL